MLVSSVGKRYGGSRSHGDAPMTRRRFSIGLLFILVFGHAAVGLRPEAGKPTPAPEGRDLNGAPLPPHAVARLGSVRPRLHPRGTLTATFSADQKRFATAGDAQDLIHIW